LKHAGELAKRFEEYEPMPETSAMSNAVRPLREAATARSDAERTVPDGTRAGLSGGADGWTR
jgi:hypothetical protein